MSNSTEEEKKVEINRFTFFRSYYEAAKDLNKAERESYLMAIFAFMFEDKEPQLKGGVSAAFKGIRPNLDRSKKKAVAGARGGRNRKQTESKSEANGNSACSCEAKEEQQSESNIGDRIIGVGNKEIGDKEIGVGEGINNNLVVVNSARECDPELGEVMTAFMDKMPFGSTAAGELKSYYEDFGKDICIHVRNIAIDAAALNWSYCRAVFQSYKQNKYTTLEQITAAEAQRTARKAQERHNRELSKHGPSCTGYDFNTDDLDRLTAQIGGGGE